MKLKSMGIFLLATMMGVTGARANIITDMYAGINAGMGAGIMFTKHKNYDYTGQSYGAVIGLDIPVVRAELEYNYLNDDDLRGTLAMVNAYLKMPRALVVARPYLGVGAGVFTGGSARGVDFGTSAAYQGMLGLTFNVPTLPVNLDLEARGMYTPNVVHAWGSNPDVFHADVRLKLRVSF